MGRLTGFEIFFLHFLTIRLLNLRENGCYLSDVRQKSQMQHKPDTVANVTGVGDIGLPAVEGNPQGPKLEQFALEPSSLICNLK